MAPKYMVLHLRKKAVSPQKNFFLKKKKKKVQLLSLWFRNIVIHGKVISKIQTIKNEENSVNHFGYSHLANLLNSRQD